MNTKKDLQYADLFFWEKSFILFNFLASSFTMHLNERSAQLIFNVISIKISAPQRIQCSK